MFLWASIFFCSSWLCDCLVKFLLPLQWGVTQQSLEYGRSALSSGLPMPLQLPSCQMSPNGSQMASKWIPNDSQMTPKWLIIYDSKAKPSLGSHDGVISIAIYIYTHVCISEVGGMRPARKSFRVVPCVARVRWIRVSQSEFKYQGFKYHGWKLIKVPRITIAWRAWVIRFKVHGS